MKEPRFERLCPIRRLRVIEFIKEETSRFETDIEPDTIICMQEAWGWSEKECQRVIKKIVKFHK